MQTDHCKKLVYKHRLEMYGDVYESPLAYAGERVKVLSGLVALGQADMMSCETMGEASKIRAEIRSHLAQIKVEADSTQTEMVVRQEAGSLPVIEARGSQEAMRALLDELSPMVALDKAAGVPDAEEEVQ